jgi:ketopantoate reductase
MAGSIGILGAGTIGLYLAHHLSSTNADVTILARPSAVDQLSRTGIELIEAGGCSSKRCVKVASVRAAEGFDLLILALKGHQLMASARELGRILKSSRIVMNGYERCPLVVSAGSSNSTDTIEFGR